MKWPDIRTDKKKIAWIGLATFFAALLFLCIIIVFVNFESPVIGEAFLKRAEAATGFVLNADSFELNLLRGVSLKNVTAEGKIRSGDLSLYSEQLFLRHRLRPLLSGKIVITHLVFDKPKIDYRETKDPTSGSNQPARRQRRAAPDDKVPASQLELQISEVQINNGSLSIQPKKGASTRVVEMVVELHDVGLRHQKRAVLRRLSGAGEISAGRVDVGKWRLKKLEGSLALSEGKLLAKSVTFETSEGKFDGQISLDFLSTPLHYDFSLKGDPFDFQAVLGQPSEPASNNPAKLELMVTGVGTQSEKLTGKGKLQLEEGTLPEWPILGAIDRHANTSIVGAKYKKSITPFLIGNRAVNLKDFRIETEEGTMDVSGSIDFNGSLDLDVNVRIPRDQVRVKHVPPALLNAISDQAGVVVLPFHVGGNRKQPEVFLRTDAVVKQMKQDAGKKLQEKLQRFLKRKSN